MSVVVFFSQGAEDAVAEEKVMYSEAQHQALVEELILLGKKMMKLMKNFRIIIWHRNGNKFTKN